MLILKPLSIDWSVAGAKIPELTFITLTGLTTRELAHVLDSLVRVSRRVEENHLVNRSHPKLPLKDAMQLDGEKQFSDEFHQAHSVTRKQLPMSSEFSSTLKSC